MRLLIVALATLIGATLAVPPAQACMWNEIYPAYWNQKPLLPREDEVVLRVELEGQAVPNPAEFNATCSGGAYVFKVVEVLHGSFDGPEIAVVLPIVGELYDSPGLGERRIIVGKILPLVQFSERWDNRKEVESLVVSGVKPKAAPYLANSSIVGGPSTLPTLELRVPIEARTIIFLSRRSVWIYLILPFTALACTGVFIWQVIVRRRRSRS